MPSDLVFLGKGNYGNVFFDRDKGVAVKRMRHTLNSSDGLSVTAMREVRILHTLRPHPNVMHVIDARLDDEHIVLEVEYLPYTLRSLLTRSRICRPEAARMTFELFTGLAHCHAHGIMHRDIKPENLLFSSSCRLKLADFGLAREVLDALPDDDARAYTPQMVSLWYRAPEVLMNQPYGMKVDIWSAGCVVGEIYRGRPLFPGDSEVGMLQLTTPTAVAVVTTLLDDDDADALEVVEACLAIAGTRISADDALGKALLVEASTRVD
tara:strand:+ start:167 stop:964 length:798 start_codon:yes stop_codon:yes gene_type:complete